jgi:two-component system response regulator AtoC
MRDSPWPPAPPRRLLETTAAGAADETAEGSPYLIAFLAGSMSVVQLVEERAYVLGRAPEVDLPIDDRLVSRHHAEVRWHRGTATLTDCGSANGTRLNGNPLVEPTVLCSGDVVGVGDAQVVFSRAELRHGPATVLEADVFRRLLYREAERSVRHLRPLTLLLLGRGSRGSSDELLCETLLSAIRSFDVVCRLDRATLAVLMPECDATKGRDAAVQLLALARRADDVIRGGVAVWPDEAPSADALLQAARVALDGAAPGECRSASSAVVRRTFGGRTVVLADSAMLQLFALVERLAPTALSVLVGGETGTGKEIVARALHHLSPRAEGPFIAVNCAALPEHLAESELFGHARGAFTGADQQRSGKIEAAHRGTLFLDEVGEMPAALQAKLLRALEEREVVRLGESTPRKLDVRVVAATNRDLKRAVDEGRFRGDLYYRLNAASVVVPPLRQRPREIPIIARLVLEEAAAADGREPLALLPETLRLLAAHPWPGNVRELRNAVERAAALATGSAIEPWLLPAEVAAGFGRGDGDAADPSRAFVPLHEEVQDLERRRIAEALDAAGGVQSHAAVLLQVPLRTFYMKVKQYGIESGQKRRPAD